MPFTGSSSGTAVPETHSVRPSDVVVGIASYNDAETIGVVLRSARDGLDRYLGPEAGTIVLADSV